MSLAMRTANAVAEVRLRAVAALLAAGVPEDCVQYWRLPSSASWSDGGAILCGVLVCGMLAAEVACWRRADQGDVVVNLSWYGEPAAWVPDDAVLRHWRGGRAPS